MRITRKRLTEIVAEECLRLIREDEDPDDEQEGGEKRSKKPSTSSADEEPVRGAGQPSGGLPKTPDASPPDGTGDVADEDPDAEGDAEEDEHDAVDPGGDAGEEPGGAVNQFMVGKTVQSISADPHSKILPGAKEVVITFNETSDPLRILCTATGEVKFFAQGQIHDMP